MVIEGIAYWASITSPNTTFEPTYTINLVIAESKADELRSQGIKVVDKDEGPTVVIKRKVNGPNGMIRSAPKLLDRNKTWYMGANDLTRILTSEDVSGTWRSHFKKYGKVNSLFFSEKNRMNPELTIGRNA